MTYSLDESVAAVSKPPSGSKQKTLKTELTFSGLGVFTGQMATMRLCPAASNHGVVFKRVDLPHQPLIPATLDYLSPSSRCSMIANGEHSVQTVEHIMAALRAFEIDNILIEIEGPEVPILDGSAKEFVQQLSEIERLGQIEILEVLRPVYHLSHPVYWSHGETHLIALPSDKYSISYVLDYPKVNAIGSQYFTLSVNSENFKNEIASARTFCLYEEVSLMLEKGLMKGAGLENGLVFGIHGVMNSEGLRFSNEPVRHKILDLIGDLALTGVYFNAQVIAIKSGHASNHRFGLELLNHIKRENSQ